MTSTKERDAKLLIKFLSAYCTVGNYLSTGVCPPHKCEDGWSCANGKELGCEHYNECKPERRKPESICPLMIPEQGATIEFHGRSTFEALVRRAECRS